MKVLSASFLFLLSLVLVGCDDVFSPTSYVFWRVYFKKNFAELVCDGKNAKNVICYDVSSDACTKDIRRNIDQCLEEGTPELPFFIFWTSEASRLGVELGSCADEKFHEIHKATYIPGPLCRNATKYVHGEDPAEKRLRQWVNDQSHLKVLLEIEPVRREELLELSIQEGIQSSPKTQKRLDEIKQEMFAKYLRKTSDDAILSFSLALIDMLEHHHKSNPQACHQHYYGVPLVSDEESNKAIKGIPIEVLRRFDAEYRNAFREGAKHSVEDPPESVVDEYFQAAIATLPDDIATKIVGDDNPIPEDGCSVLIAMHKSFHTLPKEQAAALARFFAR